jgi:hypothetical protein
VVKRFAQQVARDRGAGRPADRSSNRLLHATPDGQVELLFHGAGPLTADRRQSLRSLGARITSEVSDGGVRYGAPVSMVTAWLPHARLDDAEALSWVAAITPPEYGEVDTHPNNTTNSQGVALHRADLVQTRGFNGAGVNVGVVSDGVANLAAAQAGNDLPPNCANPPVAPCVSNLSTGSNDEGTAMLEIVHDMAPGARLLFNGTGSGVTAHISALNALVTNGANVITEDIAFDSEPAFQRGAAATAGDTIAANGVPVHSSAGNLAQRHAARVTATGTGQQPDGTANAFTGCTNTPDNVVAIAPSNDTTFDVQLPAQNPALTAAQNTASFTLQWSEPRAIAPTPGAGGFTDLNLYIMNSTLTQCLAQSTGVQGGGAGDTIEQASLARFAAATYVKIVVAVQGATGAVAAPTLDLRWRGANAIDTATAAGSLNPDSNYTGAATSSAAVDAQSVTAGLGALEGYSAQGPVQLFSTTVCAGGNVACPNGVAGPAAAPANGPAWAAADNVNVSGVGGFGSPFTGTSAAAPHAAACDALLRDARDTPAAAPGTTAARLAATALDIAPAGFDQATGPGQLDCLAAINRPPVASIGGPYGTDEGTDVSLNAGGSTDPDTTATFTDTLTFAWDLDNDGAFDDAVGATPSFTSVGQDGVYPIAVRVTDTAGATATASTSVTVRNVAPSVSPASITSVAENTATTVAGTITDPGWLDPLTATIDFGDGAGAQPLTGTVENVRPDATFTYSLQHVYGDNGDFTVTVCAADDDTTGNCRTVQVTVTNVNPTAAINTGGTTLVNGVPTYVTHVGSSVTFSGTSTDPGSDDLTLTWDWDDGAPTPDVSTTYLVNPPNPDLLPSPSIQPRNLTDQQLHAFAGACLYRVTFGALDDDTGTAASTIVAIIQGNATKNRSAGYWYTQLRDQRDFTSAQLVCLLKIVDYMSRVFSERNDARTIALASAILNPPTTATTAVQQFDRQLLAAWINFANGAMDLTTLVDTDGKKGPDTQFIVVMTRAENTRLNPSSTSSALTQQKTILERINLRDGG